MNRRLKNLFRSFDRAGIDALLVSSWPNVTYLSGFNGTESWALVSPKGSYFITDSRYLEQAEKEARGFHVLLRDKKGVAEIVADLARKRKWRSVGFEAPVATYTFYKALEKYLGGSQLVATRGLVERLREIKDSTEIQRLKESARIAVEGYHYVRHTVRPGMREREVQGRLEYFTKSLGADKPAFDIIIASGARASMPHCQTNETIIRDDNMVLVDMGVVYEGYHSDLTRPIFLGKMSSLQKKIFNIVWKAQRSGIKKARPGVAAKDVDAACRRIITEKGYGRYFGHGTGHGVGLEIHEAPTVSSKSDVILKPGMVITVEPGIYLPGKFGVRIEDMVLITKNGNEVLTRDLDKPV